MAVRGCSWLLMAVRGCSWLLVGARAATKAREATPYVSCEGFVEHCNWRKGRNQRKTSKSIHSCDPARVGFRGLGTRTRAWLFVPVRGCSWLLVAVRGCSWLLVALRGCSLLFVAGRACVAVRGCCAADSKNSPPTVRKREEDPSETNKIEN